jgi:predicted ATPase
MNMQRIEINNFGPIKEMKLDIKDFMLFIGPQASGKSTIAKTIFFFKSLNDDLVKYLMEGFEKKDFSKPMGTYAKKIRQKFLDYFGASLHLMDVNLKYYYNGNIWISITLGSHDYITPKFSPEFEVKTKKIVEETLDFSNSFGQRNPALLTSKDLLDIENKKRDFFSHTKQRCNHLFNEEREIIFIPAGRSLLATLSDQLPFINTRNLDFLMRTFVDKINLLKSTFNKSLNEIIDARKYLTQSKIDFETIRLAEKIIQRILKGKYQYDSDGEKIFYDNGKYVRLNFASSGQQEALWILLLLFIVILEQQNVFIVIEEPEAHLFPEAQKDISAIIALVSNMKQSQVIITTHSPYILASVNNLILANKVGKKHPDEVSTRINKHLWINRNKIFAAMVQSGIASKIIDTEFDIIQQEHVDKVSQTINEEFDFLYQYETTDNDA